MRSRLIRMSSYGLGLTIAILSIAGHAFAQREGAAPEIDGATLASGLGLLTAGVLILKSRWK